MVKVQIYKEIEFSEISIQKSKIDSSKNIYQLVFHTHFTEENLPLKKAKLDYIT